MTILAILNMVLFQWFCIRLTRCKKTEIGKYKLIGHKRMINGDIATIGDCEVKVYQWYSIQFWILPLTGWFNNFIYLNGSPEFIKLTKSL